MLTATPLCTERLWASVPNRDMRLHRAEGPRSAERARSCERGQDFLVVCVLGRRYNMWDRSSERNGVLPYCEQHGLAFLPWPDHGVRANEASL